MRLEFDEIVRGKKKDHQESGDDFFNFGEWELDEGEDSIWRSWKPWLEAVTGHHGSLIKVENINLTPLPSECPPQYQSTDKAARKSWFLILETLFLKPVGLSLKDSPPGPPGSAFLAGFCSVSDWLGSANSEDRFSYLGTKSDLSDYMEDRCQTDAPEALALAGLIGKGKPYMSVKALLKPGHQPLQVQTLVDQLTVDDGLTLIEAPTGSGKTEAALAYAWRLLDMEKVESIVFALPTQATANAMFKRLEKLSTKLFDHHPNLLLAHGNARYNKDFLRLSASEERSDYQDAWAQCSAWLSQSRKRAFLGQIGVCTIDQVLISVLPVRHRFIRGFGIGRSLLIVDEVHAYDTYMYGLLKAVLKEQQTAGGSVLLLSATLPNCQRKELFQAWDNSKSAQSLSSETAYPLISQITSNKFGTYELKKRYLPENRKVFIEPLTVKKCFPPDDLLDRICEAAEGGASIAVICNLVDSAQQLSQILAQKVSLPVMLFHSRFTLRDRQAIETRLLDRFGFSADRSGGAILVATQVVEQSLDVDFDWMVTQLCPVDLLFQRLGRLHRHAHKDHQRPSGLETPCCTVLLPEGLDYGAHGLIYKNTRVMWRTTQKIMGLNEKALVFPHAYRSWVEAVYDPNPWGNEPAEVKASYREFMEKHQEAQRFAANLMLNSTQNMTPLADDDQHVTAVTRDGPMSLTLVPYLLDSDQDRVLRDGTCYDHLNRLKKPEALAMNKVAVPDIWKSILDKNITEEEGIYWLPMAGDGSRWRAQVGNWELIYQSDTGLERIR